MEVPVDLRAGAVSRVKLTKHGMITIREHGDSSHSHTLSQEINL